ncbi:MAG: hypothetical protein JJU31_07560 [Wenzhouxiangella sp.]|nr:hypothetical protein [Wenzhouxiangella sp.]TVR95771.1 MAG: hypothetical protein EA418_06865 [Wenzhouxiangellaceae bacterium]
MSTLDAFFHDQLQAGARPAGIEALTDAITQRHGASVRAIVLYGSCLRKADAGDGLVDLLVLVDSYRSALSSPLATVLNWLLPPNVYYLEAADGERRLRCKYALVTLRQFRRRMLAASDLYFWARFCQPVRLVAGSADHLIARARADAARGFCRRIAPLLDEPHSAQALWARALATSYRCELRPEPPDNAARLIAHDPDYWQALSQLLAAEGLLQASDTGYLSPHGFVRRQQARLGWLLRRCSGKLFNLARLFKAAGTFSNGIDYLVWKVERHSGVRIEPTERMRRHPRLAAWGLAWRMWRQGGFR